jgi:UDP:flavonoid glycosyltransferase YjiC (YdhE family)
VSFWQFLEWWQLNDLRCQQQQTNDLMEQNNQLLEKIRRMQLTPAQRAREDVLRAAEAQLATEKEKKTTQRFYLIWSLILVVCISLATWTGWASQPHPTTTAYLEGPSPTPTVQAQPDYAPRAELVHSP